MSQSKEELVDVFGRRFVLLIEGPMAGGRYEIRIWEGRRGPRDRQFLRAPIRGRDVDEARERALEVLHNYVGLDRYRLMVEEIAHELAPGSTVEVGEDARDLRVALEGAYRLAVPLIMSRGQVLDPDADPERLREAVRAHVQAHIRPR